MLIWTSITFLLVAVLLLLGISLDLRSQNNRLQARLRQRTREAEALRRNLRKAPGPVNLVWMEPDEWDETYAEWWQSKEKLND